MKPKFFLKKALTIFLSCAIMVTSGTGITFSSLTAFADSPQTNSNQREYDHDGYKVTYTVNSSWDVYQNISVTVANTDDTAIENWALSYDFGGEIQNIWNAVVGETGSFTYVQNNGQNYDIAPNATFNFGYTLKDVTTGYFPADISLCQSRLEVDSDDYSAVFNVTNDWGAGFSGEFVITNLSNVAIRNPELSLKSNFNVVDAWSFDVTYSGDDSDGKSYKIKALADNRVIAPGGSVTLGFNGERITTLGESDANYTLSASAFSLTAVYVTDSNAPEQGDGDEEETDEEIDYTDTDEDGLPDFYEETIGTDPNNADTDGDGLPDGYEVSVLGTDPLLTDTDSNDISDADEDFDEDGLSNLDEYSLNTVPNDKDSDRDGLTDGDEVNNYGTDPLCKDTDNDGLSDYTEIISGTNPLVADSDGNGLLDGEELITQTITISDNSNLSVTPTAEVPYIGDLSNELRIKAITRNKEIIELPYIVGEPFEFEHNIDFSVDNATVSFLISDELLAENEIDDLAVAFYSVDTDSAYLCDTEVVNSNTISANVDHFSVYIVVNRNKYVIANTSEEYGEITVDNGFKTQAVQYNGHYYAFIDNVAVGDSGFAAADAFSKQMGGHLVTITSAEEQQFVEELVQSNGTKETYWIGLTNPSGDNQTWIWKTAEEFSYSNWGAGEPNSSNEKWAQLVNTTRAPYPVGKWNDTLGDFVSGNAWYSSVNRGLIIEWDNLPEVDNGCTVVLDDNGYPKAVTLLKDPELGDTTFDSDGDGVPDLDELINKIHAPWDNSQFCWTFKSNPIKTDTDSDGYTDDVDPLPRWYGIVHLESPDTMIDDWDTKDKLLTVMTLQTEAEIAFKLGNISESVLLSSNNEFNSILDLLRADYIIALNNPYSDYAYQKLGGSKQNETPLTRNLVLNEQAPQVGFDVLVFQRALEFLGYIDECSYEPRVYNRETFEAYATFATVKNTPTNNLGSDAYVAMFNSDSIGSRTFSRGQMLFMYNAQHKEVQRVLVEKIRNNGYKADSEVSIKSGGPNGGYGRIDVIAGKEEFNWSDIWEVKHNTEKNVMSGIPQLIRYRSAAKRLQQNGIDEIGNPEKRYRLPLKLGNAEETFGSFYISYGNSYLYVSYARSNPMFYGKGGSEIVSIVTYEKADNREPEKELIKAGIPVNVETFDLIGAFSKQLETMEQDERAVISAMHIDPQTGKVLFEVAVAGDIAVLTIEGIIELGLIAVI